MTYPAHNKPKSDIFSRIIRFCNNLLPDYQNICPKCTQWLRRDAEASFRGRKAGRVYGPPKIYDFRFFPVNRTFETVLLLQKQYVMQT